ncbi:hypothetical protein ES703_57740 [subsurface metagenome]
MKTRWYSILLIGLVLLLASSIVGCGQSQSEAYQEGYKAGFTDGYEAGLAQSGVETVPTPSTALEPSPKTETPPIPADAISWDKAKDHIGDRTTVCGPVAGTKYGATSSGKPTWLNIGKDYPSSERFVVIIWGENRSNFPQPPESYYDGKTIYVTGLIQEYNGIPQIEVTTPDQIQEQ